MLFLLCSAGMNEGDEVHEQQQGDDAALDDDWQQGNNNNNDNNINIVDEGGGGNDGDEYEDMYNVQDLINDLNNDINANANNNNNNNKVPGGFEAIPTTTQQNRPLIAFNGKLYCVEKTVNDRQYLRCIHCHEGTAVRDAYAEGDFGPVEYGNKRCSDTCEPSLQRFQRRALVKLAAGAFAADVRVRRGPAVDAGKAQYAVKYGPAPVLQQDDPVPPTVLYRARQARYPPVPTTRNYLPNYRMTLQVYELV